MSNPPHHPGKRGHNKGIAAAKKVRKREEAEARNEAYQTRKDKTS